MATMLVARGRWLLALAPSRLQHTLTPAAGASAPRITSAASLSTSADSSDYSNFNDVVKVR